MTTKTEQGLEAIFLFFAAVFLAMLVAGIIYSGGN
jgi:heme/copper-type cytochrome/quinol oxidase subunit 4